MAHKKKCPECNGCMDTMYIQYHRFYYCEFCRTYYGGMDEALSLIPKEIIHAMLKGDKEIYGNYQQGNYEPAKLPETG